MNGICVLILEVTLELFQSCYYALELYQRLPMKIKVKLPVGETSPMDKQKWCNANMTGLLYSERKPLLISYQAHGTKEISGMNILQ